MDLEDLIPMLPSLFDAYFLLSLFGVLSTGILGVGLIRWENTKAIHRHYAHLVFSISGGLLFRVLFDVSDLAFFYGISWVFLAASPIFLSLAFEKTVHGHLLVVERLFLLGGCITFSLVGLIYGYPPRAWLITFGCFHFVVVLVNLGRMIRASLVETNKVQRTLFRGLAFSLSFCLVFLVIDWLNRISGEQTKPFPIAVIAFTYLLSRIIFVGNISRLTHECLRIGALLAMSYFLLVLGLETTHHHQDHIPLLSVMVLFGLLMLCFQVFHQIFPTVVLTTSIEPLETQVQLKDLVSTISNRPELTSFCLIKNGFLIEQECSEVFHLFQYEGQVWSLDQTRRLAYSEHDLSLKNSFEQLIYIMMVTGTENLIRVPGNQRGLLGFTFVPLVNPYIYLSAIRLCSYQVALQLRTQNDRTLT